MTIDTSGEWWVGTEPLDIDAYLKCYLAQAFPVDEFRLAKCGCGSIAFGFEADDGAGCAKRTCVQCGKQHFVCDSEEYWSEARPDIWACICGEESANLGTAFVFYDEPDDDGRPVVKWLSVGTRCTSCGTLGCFVGWKVGYSPSYQLLDQV